jgi:hypothetical protein
MIKTTLAINIVYAHYDINFLKLLDVKQLEDLFIQDAFNNPHKHLTLEFDKDKINFEYIKQELTSS